MGPSCVITVILISRGLLHTPFKSLFLQKDRLLSEMLVTRLPASCCPPYALLDLLFLQIKAAKLCRKFPSCLQTIWATKTTQLLVVRWWKEVSRPPALPLLTHYKDSFLALEGISYGCHQGQRAFFNSHRTEQASDWPFSTD